MPRVEVEVEVVPVQIQSRSQSSRQGVSQGPIGNSPVGSPTGTHPGSMQVSLSHESLQQSPSKNHKLRHLRTDIERRKNVHI